MEPAIPAQKRRHGKVLSFGVRETGLLRPMRTCMKVLDSERLGRPWNCEAQNFGLTLLSYFFLSDSACTEQKIIQHVACRLRAEMQGVPVQLCMRYAWHVCMSLFLARLVRWMKSASKYVKVKPVMPGCEPVS
jgi:hypothetical protein